MGWIIAIICIILVAIFWRVLLPIAVIAALAIGAVFLYVKVDNDRAEKKQQQAERELQERIATANAAVRQMISKGNATASEIDRRWEVISQPDPASGEKVPRAARVLSDNGLCTLQVEQRINGVKLAGIYCDRLKLSHRADIDVKFDNRSTSDSMKIAKFSDGDDIYITSHQPTYSGRLSYAEFLRRMTQSKRVALHLSAEGAGQHWFTFSLSGSDLALATIGAVEPPRRSAQSSAAKKRPATQMSGAGTAAAESASASTKQPESSTENGRDDVQATPSTRGVPRLPANAKLNYRGDDWECERGYRRVGSGCVVVEMPANAKLNYRGDDWECERGYRRVGSGCVAVEMPANAKLNYRGNDWECERGFRRAGSECIPVGVSTTLGR